MAVLVLLALAQGVASGTVDPRAEAARGLAKAVAGLAAGRASTKGAQQQPLSSGSSTTPVMAPFASSSAVSALAVTVPIMPSGEKIPFLSHSLACSRVARLRHP